MNKKNLVLKIVILCFVILTCYKIFIPIYSANKLEKNWKSIETSQVPAHVLNEYKRQVNKKSSSERASKGDFDAIVLLDSNGAIVLNDPNLSLSITKNQIWKFSYNLWTIHYNNHSLPIAIRMFTPPYIIYSDTIYYNPKKYNTQMGFVYHSLK